MFRFVGLCFGMVVHLFRGRRSLLLENLASRQQLVALKRRHPRPSLDLFGKRLRPWISLLCQRFGVLYCFFVIGHDRRHILHVNVTKHPTSAWIIQRLREAFPFEAAHKYLICDRDQKFGFEVIAAVKATRIIPKRTSFRSPWQNSIAERWVGSCRRDLLDHMVALNERHLKRLLSEYVRYHHEDRTHLGLEKGTPDGRFRSVASGRVLSQERLGGLHHRYNRAA
jgi:putative transposase